MTRDLTNHTQNAVNGSVVRPIWLVALYFTETLYICTSDTDITWSGNTYVGKGALGKVTLSEETSDLQIADATLELSGILAKHVSLVLNEKYSGRTVKIWLGFLDASWQLTDDPVLLFEGFAREMPIKLGNTATVSLKAENELARWEIPNIRRLTNADQQAMYPGDKGLEFANEVTDKEITWGVS